MHDLDDDAFVDDETVTRGCFVRDRADVGRRIDLIAVDAARLPCIAQRRRKRLGGNERLRNDFGWPVSG